MKTLEAELVALLEQVAVNSGLSPSTATIVGFLYFQPQEVPMKEVARHTGYSLSSISLKIKMLEQMGLVKRKKHPGTSKVFLYMEKDMLGGSLKAMLELKLKNIEFIKSHLPSIIEQYSQKKLSEKESSQLQLARFYLNQANKMETLLNKVRKWLSAMEEKR